MRRSETMDSTRQTRSTALELKFLIDATHLPALLEWVRVRSTPDPHGSGAHQDEYSTATLYFDTEALDVFHRRGSYGRAKYRMRRYNDAGPVFLERKLRRPGLLIKRRTPVELASIDTLTNVPAGDGASTAGPDSIRGEWFRDRIEARRLRPSAQVSYRRVARLLDTGARLTIDRDISAARMQAAAFTGDPGVPILPGIAIVEMKYLDYVPLPFRELVMMFRLAPAIGSKYRLGMQALGVGEDATRPLALRARTTHV